MLDSLIQNYHQRYPDDHLFYLAMLKAAGKLFQTAYKINPDPKLKQNILNLKHYIETYEPE